MKKRIALILAVLLALSMFTTAFAATYKDKATVKAVQQALNDAGYNCGTPDGAAGKKTKAAIESFQTDHGLEVTREIDDALLEALGLAEEQAEAEDEEYEDAEYEEAEERAQVMGDLYNLYYLDVLDGNDIDIEGGEDIGQDAYMIISYIASTDSFNLYSPSPSNNVKLYMESEYPTTGHLKLPDENRQIGLLEYAAMYSTLGVINAYFEGGGNGLASVISLLGAAPERDGAISLDDIPLVADGGVRSAELPYVLSCEYDSVNNEIVIRAKKSENVSEAEGATESEDATVTEEAEEAPAEAESIEAEQGNEDLDLPADLVAATGGIPRSLDEIPDKYKVNMERAIEDYRTIAPGEALKALKESGSCTLAAPGGITIDPQVYASVFAGVKDTLEESGFRSEHINEIESAGDHIVMTTKGVPENTLYLSLTCYCLAGMDYYDGMWAAYGAYEESVESDEQLRPQFKDVPGAFSAQEGEAYWENYVMMFNDDVDEAKPENGRYSYRHYYVERSGGNVEIIQIVQQEVIGDRINSLYLWEGYYDPDTGERIATSEEALSNN